MFLTLDVGTTAVKAGLYDEKLKLLAFRIEEYELLYREDGGIEMNPETYWEKAVSAIRGALEGKKEAAESIRAVTCTTQGETLIPVDRQGKPLGNAVVWLDARAAREAEQIRRKVDLHIFYQKTGQPELTGSLPLCKLLWFRENKRDVYDRTWKFFLLEDYLVYRLCGRACSNPSLLCSTGYFDSEQGRTWEYILNTAGIDPEKIPACIPCGNSLGPISREAAMELGISPKAQVVTGAMDQAASALGAGNLKPGVLMETTGTCQTVLSVCDTMDTENRSPVTYYTHAIAGKYLKLTYSQTAGMALKWFRREFCPDLEKDGDVYERMNVLAGGEPVLSRGVFFYPHMAGTLLPREDEWVRGAFLGAGLDSTRGSFIRAVMEGVGYMLKENLEAMGEEPERILSLGGGAKSPVWCQIKADICGAPVVTLEQTESTSLGAAMLAAVGVGTYSTVYEAAEVIEEGVKFWPDRERARRYEQGYGNYKKIYWALEPLYGKGREKL